MTQPMNQLELGQGGPCMSIVSHRLNQEGQARFSDWFSRLRAVLQQEAGFVSVRAFVDAAVPSARHVLLELANEAALLAWTSGEAKAPLLREIESLSTEPWTALRLQEMRARLQPPSAPAV